MIIARHRTAIHRHDLSRPLRLAIEDGLLSNGDTVFDYGCGHGDDLVNLRERGIICAGWDPNHYPDGERQSAPVVNLGYVVNVIENADEREAVLRDAWSLTQKLLIVSARLDVEARGAAFSPYQDGYLTRLTTFQKYFEQRELREWIDAVLGESGIAAGPGTFYVFRDERAKESFLASRHKRALRTPRVQRSTILFEQHKSLLEPLMSFLASKGRLPVGPESGGFQDVQEKLGGLKRAFRLIVKVTGQDAWKDIREQRTTDLLVYLALSRFGGRPRLSDLPIELQMDIRAFFSNYGNACKRADELLFSAGSVNVVSEACRKSSIGKLTPGSLYVHVSAIPQLVPVLRVYEGCARAYIGSVEGANLVKLKYRYPQVSYLAYPDFERDPHPSLFASLVVPLQTFRVQYREYKESKNPPVLHRKELFLAPEHPLHERFERLTKQEEKHGLFEHPREIGTQSGWDETLRKKGFLLSGHRLVRSKGIPT